MQLSRGSGSNGVDDDDAERMKNQRYWEKGKAEIYRKLFAGIILQ